MQSSNDLFDIALGANKDIAIGKKDQVVWIGLVHYFQLLSKQENLLEERESPFF